MTSAQGQTSKLSNDYSVTQTIGQQAAIGSSFSQEQIVIQGFQQGMWSKLIQESTLSKLQTVTVFPNPFVESINFQFGESLKGDVRIMLFDVSGRLVAERLRTISGDVLTLPLNFLAQGMYLVQLRHNGFTYYTKIVKNTN